MKFISSFFSFLMYVYVVVDQANAQTNPPPFDLSSGNYSFTTWDASSPAGTYPPNMMFHRGPSQDPILTAEPNADYTGAYNGTSGSRMNGLGTNGFSWRNTGTTGTLGAAVLALNTTGVSNVFVSWTGGTVDIQNEREYRIRLQYRIGTSGPFSDVPGPIEYVSATIGHSQDFGPTPLPATVNNQPVVQLRWKYYYVSAIGNRPQLRVGNILVQTGQIPGDGTGSAHVLPDTLNGGVTGSILLVYRQDTSFSVNGLRIVVPPAFTWSQNRSDVSFTNMTATDTVIGDTITFSNIVFSVDSTVITIANITSPDSTAFYPFRVQSKENSFADVVPTPRMVVFGAPVPIAEVKANDANGVPLRLGELVTIEGIVTVANEFGGPSFIQDNSGGMSVFTASFSTAVNIGDEVKVSGVVSAFNGLNQIGSGSLPVYLHGIISSGNTIDPLVVTCSQLFNDGQGGAEQYEGLLVRINVVTLLDTITGFPPPTWSSCGSASGCNYRLVDASGYVEIRADNNVNFFSASAPQGVFDVSGVVGQFRPSPPFIGGYQLMPRFSQEIFSTGPIIATAPVESNIQQHSLTVGWTTVNPGTSRLRYGRTISYEIGVGNESDTTTSSIHSVDVQGLDPATIYNMQAFSVYGVDTSVASNLVVSTSSAPPSTGRMNVYFNMSIDSSVSTGETARGNQDLVATLVQRINNARRSIDVCLYSLSANNQGDVIANALVAAKNRGIKVRVICEADNQTSPGNSFAFLSSNGITVINDRFDAVWNGQGLMHNKFFVFDYRGGAPESIWVWTGSWNPTFQGTMQDRQNVIEIQDVALAGAYTVEFNEMWGSNSDTPNQASSRFGGRKRDNTPHNFVINAIPTGAYFSPSDATTSRIRSTLARAQSSVSVAILAFTRRDIADTLIARRNVGRRVRVVMDNNTDTGNQYSYLLSNEMDVHLRGGTGLLHHKYAIVDGDNYAGTQYVITGSHNWSNSAENSNDENTVIVQNNRIGNLYLQEFAARYIEAGGTDSIIVSVLESKEIPDVYSLSQNFPNPFNPTTEIRYQISEVSYVTLKIYNLLGQEVTMLVNEEVKPGSYEVTWDAAGFASGVYFYRLFARDVSSNAENRFVETRKLMLLR